MSPSAQHYSDALGRILKDPELRVFLWRLIVEDCRVFQEDFATNAGAYCLLAKQEIGKRLLNDAKALDFDGVVNAEREYNDLMRRNAEFQRGNTGEM